MLQLGFKNILANLASYVRKAIKCPQKMVAIHFRFDNFGLTFKIEAITPTSWNFKSFHYVIMSPLDGDLL